MNGLILVFVFVLTLVNYLDLCIIIKRLNALDKHLKVDSNTLPVE